MIWRGIDFGNALIFNYNQYNGVIFEGESKMVVLNGEMMTDMQMNQEEPTTQPPLFLTFASCGM